MDLDIEKMLVISTGHITEKDMTLLTEEGLYPYTILQTGYGTIISLVTNMTLPPREQSVDFITEFKEEKWMKIFSKEFMEILRIAKENDCFWVNFDRDGSQYEELPLFEW